MGNYCRPDCIGSHGVRSIAARMLSVDVVFDIKIERTSLMSTYFGGTMKRLNSNRGSVIIFVTLIITLLLVMVGIGLDTGMLTYVRSQAQPAADAAALAAASGLLGGQSEVEKRVAAYNTTNDYVGQPGSTLGPANVTPIIYDGSSIQGGLR
jgi:Putative Flp pilus-assembly TadE/G-like